MKKRPTQVDVAKKAGVSRSTVSLIINNQVKGNVRISDETRQRVKDAVIELGYQPNGVAQSLRRQRTNLLAVLVPDITNPYYPMLIRGIQAAVAKEDYQLLIFDSDDSAEREYDFLSAVLRRRVDGVMLVPFHLGAKDIESLINAGIKVSVLGKFFEGLGLNANRASVDHQSAIIALFQHLVDKGHQRIAHIAGPQDTPPGLNRLNYYRTALAEFDLPYDPNLVKVGTFRQDGIPEITRSLVVDLPAADRPTAIFAANDVMAIETIHTLRGLDISIPTQMAVCGFDDIPQASWIRPALTTIGQNPYEQGRQAANLLLERLLSEDTQPIKHVTVPFELALRDST